MRGRVQWAPFWMPEEKKKEYIRQRELILEFDRKLKKATSNGMEPVQALLNGVYVAVIAMIAWIPFDWEDVSVILICMLGVLVWPTGIYLSKYLCVNESGKMHSVYEKLKYMPVEMHIVRWVRMEYLLRFLKLPLITALAAQLIGAWLCNHRITIANVIYPIVVMGCWPLLIGWLDIVMTKNNNRAV